MLFVIGLAVTALVAIAILTIAAQEVRDRLRDGRPVRGPIDRFLADFAVDDVRPSSSVNISVGRSDARSIPIVAHRPAPQAARVARR